MSSVLQAIVEDIADYLGTHPEFWESNPAVPVVALTTKDKISELTKQRAKLQVGCVVTLLNGTVTQPDANGPIFDALRFAVFVYENRAINTTGKSAEEILEHVLTILHHYQPQGFDTCLRCENFEEVPAENDGDLNHRIMVANFSLMTGLDLTAISTVATPTITVDGGSATIACATSGATIKYTTDGSTPTYTNGTTYTTPISVASGDVVKARGYKTAMRASAVATETVS